MPSNDPTPKADRLIVWVFLCSALVLRVLFAVHLRVDSDEPQPLHIMWAWSHGLIPYRDIFDNHPSLFHVFCVPLFNLLGTRPDILIPMRLALIPLTGIIIWCVWRISASLFSRRVALWTTAFATFFPPFFISSVEFRADQLWTAVWLLLLMVLVTGRLTTKRAFVVGLLLGLAFSVSLKTTLLAASLGMACIGILLSKWYAKQPIETAHLAKYLSTAIAGLLIVPVLVVLFFLSQHAGAPMWYCLVTYNILIKSVTPGPSTFHCLMRWIVLLPIEVAGVWAIWKWQRPAFSRLSLIFLTGTFSYTTLLAFWPLREGQTFLPIFSVLAISVAPVVLRSAGFISARIRLPLIIMPAAIVMIEIILTCLRQSPFTDRTSQNTQFIRDVLNLTAESDYVMDSKGEAIFRRRPYYFMIDKITKEMIDRGLVHDDIPHRLIETRTPLITTDPKLPKCDAAFLESNYLPIAPRLAVLGKMVRRENEGSAEPIRFDVTVPGRYALVSTAGKITGVLDDTELTEARELAAGLHTFRPTSGAGPVALVWTPAVERGYSPFAISNSD